MHTRQKIALAFIATASFAIGFSTASRAAEATEKVIAENEKLQVLDVVQPPGSTNPMGSRLGLVIHWITGGTVERTYADGTKENTVRTVKPSSFTDIS